MKQDTGLDYCSRVFCVIGVALPTFWFGILIVYALAAFFQWLPPLGYATLWDDPLLSPLAAALESSGIEVISPARHSFDRLAEVAAGITTADAAIALTGTLLLPCDARRPRSTSLLPPLHMAVLPANRIVPTLGHLFQELSRPLPSALTFITGPSRTADIELTPVMGAHGPTEVIVYLVRD